tara:strand:- start:231 stop:452 length:222 start_codon:yes stop_codon:yes gene_type:complete
MTDETELFAGRAWPDEGRIKAMTALAVKEGGSVFWAEVYLRPDCSAGIEEFYCDEDGTWGLQIEGEKKHDDTK